MGSVRDSGASRFYRLAPARLDHFAKRLWQVVREQVSSSSAAQQDARRRESVLSGRRVKMQSFFSGVAASWDQLRAELIGSRTDLLAMMDLFDESWTVGDLGCGTGYLSETLAPVVQRVVAVDESGAMLTRSAKSRLRRGRESGTVEALPVEDESWTSRYSSCDALVLEHEAVAECGERWLPAPSVTWISTSRARGVVVQWTCVAGLLRGAVRSWVSDDVWPVRRGSIASCRPSKQGAGLFSLVAKKSNANED